MKVENVAINEPGFIEKVIQIKKLPSGNYEVRVKATPTRKGNVQIIALEFTKNGFSALLGSMMAIEQA